MQSTFSRSAEKYCMASSKSEKLDSIELLIVLASTGVDMVILSKRSPSSYYINHDVCVKKYFLHTLSVFLSQVLFFCFLIIKINR